MCARKNGRHCSQLHLSLSLALFPFSPHVLPLSLFWSVSASIYLSVSLYSFTLSLSFSLALLPSYSLTLSLLSPFSASGSLVLPALLLLLCLYISLSLLSRFWLLFCLLLCLGCSWISLALPFAPCILISHLPRFLTILSLSKCMHSDPSFYISVQLIYFYRTIPCLPPSLYIYLLPSFSLSLSLSFR